MKSIIRDKVLEQRKKMANHPELSKKIFETLLETDDFKNAKTVMFYLSKPGEVETTSFLKGVDKDIVVPVLENEEIMPALLLDFDFVAGKYNIKEPKNKLFTKKEEIDLVIVPGIAFDSKGNRIGYGKGYYDRFLKNIKAKKVALAFDFQVVDYIDPNSHDVRMDKIVTEKRVIECR